MRAILNENLSAVLRRKTSRMVLRNARAASFRKAAYCFHETPQFRQLGSQLLVLRPTELGFLAQTCDVIQGLCNVLYFSDTFG